MDVEVSDGFLIILFKVPKDHSLESGTDYSEGIELKITRS